MNPGTSSDFGTPKSPRFLGGLPLGLASAVALVLLCEWGVWNNQHFCAVLERHTAHGFASDALRTTARIVRLDAGEDASPVILLGSSQVLDGLDAPALGGLLSGRKCVNLAVDGGTPFDSLFLMDQLHERTPNCLVVMGLLYRLFEEPPKENFTNHRTLGAIAKGHGLTKLGLSGWRDLLIGECQSWITTLRLREGLGRVYKAVKKDPAGAWRMRLPAASQFRANEREGQKEAGTPEPLAARRDDPPEPFPVERSHLVASNMAALEMLLDREAALGNTVILLEFPVVSDVGVIGERALSPAYGALRSRLRSRPGVLFYDAGSWGDLNAGDFRDTEHLGSSGRGKMTAYVSRIIAGIGE